MSRKALFHFALVGILWGIPYLLMKVAVEDFPPAAVVAGRRNPSALLSGSYQLSLGRRC